MFTEEMLIDVIRKISGQEEIRLHTEFVDLNMDSVGILESLIELELLLDIDVLDEELVFNDLKTVKDIYDFVSKMVKE